MKANELIKQITNLSNTKAYKAAEYMKIHKTTYFKRIRENSFSLNDLFRLVKETGGTVTITLPETNTTITLRGDDLEL